MPDGFEDPYDNNRNSFKNKAIMALTAICIGVVAIVVILEYTEPQYKEFSEESFYTGYLGEEGDPKTSWENLNNIDSLGANSCDTTVRRVQEYDGFEDHNDYDYIVTGMRYWVATHDVPASVSDITSGSILSGVYEDGDLIVTPGMIRFTNSNVDQSITGIGTYIEGYLVSTNYLVRWENVDCWWCHINKESTSHTSIVGKSGVVTQVTQGYVIGQANADTIVRLYTYDTTGNLTEASWQDYYSDNGMYQ